MFTEKFKNVYIAGCGGMLGKSVYEVFSKCSRVHASDIVLNEEWLTFADIRDHASISKSIIDAKPDVIINLAAITDMEECERDPENAWLTNSLGAENIALVAIELNVPLVYISTAGIFGGEKEFFNDFDTPNPLSIYAKSKYAGEMFVKQMLQKHFVVRAGWMMGGGPSKDKKFINKIYKQLVNGSKSIYVVDDKLGTPTYTKDFAFGLVNLLSSGLYGTYNQVCPGSCSRYEIAKRFVELLDLDRDIQILKVDSTYFDKEYFAPRPASEKLVNMKLSARKLLTMRDWETCLEEYSGQYREHWINLHTM